MDEANETFFVNLANPSGAFLAKGQGQATIQDNDGPPITIGNTSVTEGNSGQANAIFFVSLSGPEHAQTVTVQYATANGTATTANSDYVATNGTLTFTQGQTSQSITVLVQGDTAPEVDETFLVNLSNPVNASCTATGADCQGQGTINSDDGSPGVADGEPEHRGDQWDGHGELERDPQPERRRLGGPVRRGRPGQHGGDLAVHQLHADRQRQRRGGRLVQSARAGERGQLRATAVQQHRYAPGHLQPDHGDGSGARP